LDANTKKLNQVEATEIFSRFCWHRLAGMCVAMCWLVSRTYDIPAALSYDSMDFGRCNTAQLLDWLISTHTWNIETQRWECIYGNLLCEHPIQQKEKAA
jgi:hypothetical protein